MECLKSVLDIFLKRSIQTSIVNSHTVTYKRNAQAYKPFFKNGGLILGLRVNLKYLKFKIGARRPSLKMAAYC